MMNEKCNLWEEVRNQCLREAKALMEGDTVPTAGTVETVSKLVSIAIAIDDLNLRWAFQNRSCAAVFPGRPSGQKEAKN